MNRPSKLKNEEVKEIVDSLFPRIEPPGEIDVELINEALHEMRKSFLKAEKLQFKFNVPYSLLEQSSDVKEGEQSMPRYEDVVDTVLNTLKEDPNRKWTLQELVATAGPKGPYKNLKATENCIRALSRSGRIHAAQLGRRNSSKLTYHKIQYKPSAEDVNYEATQLEKEVEQLKKQLKERKAESKNRVVEVVLKSASKKTLKKTKGMFHEKFETLLNLAEARMNIFIYGPTGCGKTHICSQLAETLKMKFAFVSCSAGMSEGVLGGRLLPTGEAGTFEYSQSEFIDCFENGGVFLLDEMDAADANVLLFINAALANGRVSIPNRIENPVAHRHKDFVCIAAANTVGTGADRVYSGRNRLDAATLDRFQIGKVYMDYDEQVEQELCPDEELYERLISYRQAIRENRLERAMSTRFMKDAYKMKTEFGWDMDAIDEAFFNGWKESEVRKVKEASKSRSALEPTPLYASF